jgi:hypothetical protein
LAGKGKGEGRGGKGGRGGKQMEATNKGEIGEKRRVRFEGEQEYKRKIYC